MSQVSVIRRRSHTQTGLVSVLVTVVLKFHHWTILVVNEFPEHPCSANTHVYSRKDDTQWIVCDLSLVPDSKAQGSNTYNPGPQFRFLCTTNVQPCTISKKTRNNHCLLPEGPNNTKSENLSLPIMGPMQRCLWHPIQFYTNWWPVFRLRSKTKGLPSRPPPNPPLSQPKEVGPFLCVNSALKARDASLLLHSLDHYVTLHKCSLQSAKVKLFPSNNRKR